MLNLKIEDLNERISAVTEEIAMYTQDEVIELK